MSLTDIVANQIEPLWHKWFVALGIAIILGGGASIPFGARTKLGGGAAVLIFVFVMALWFYRHHIPRTERGKVGIRVAIDSDDESESRQVETDFVNSLRESLRQNINGRHFQLDIVPRYISAEINQELARGGEYLKKARAHFMLYGQARKRLLEGKNTHILNLGCMVRHAVVPPEIQQTLANDMAQALPRRVMLPEDGAVIGFEATSQLVDLGARYVVGMAAYLSGDGRFAESLLLDVEDRLKKLAITPSGSLALARNVSERLKSLYVDILTTLHETFVRTRDRAYVRSFSQVADKLLARDPNNYQALCLKAIGQFLLDRNVNGALETIEKCRVVKDDATWLYSLAFLQAYQGDLEAAHDTYRRAFRLPMTDATVAAQCEEFMEGILGEEPDKQQLYFCLGLINYNVKQDFVAAESDFSRFLSWENVDRFGLAKSIATDLRKRAAEKCTPG